MRQPYKGILTVAVLIALTGLAAMLRLFLLGNTFQSSDNVELAVRIMERSGWGWMMDEPYGIMISALVKGWAMLLGALGICLDEFWWKAGLALFGCTQVVAGYGVMRWLGATVSAAVLCGGLLALLPLHVFQSRYLWGYEVLGAFWLLMATGGMVAYLSRPSLRSGLLASLLLGLYLVSHGYIIPVLPFIACMAWAMSPGGGVLQRAKIAARNLARHGLWVFPLLFFPLYRAALRHALAKDTQFGFYLDDHWVGFVGNLGWPLLAGILILVLMAWRQGEGRMRQLSGLLWLGGLWYFLPLWLGTPPGITVVRGYMLAGSVLWVAAAALAVDALRPKARRWGIRAMTLVGAWTGVGTAVILFTWKSSLGTAVLVERGSVPSDPGTKAAGWLVRAHMPPGGRMMALHRAIEPPNAIYYLGRRDSSWFDLDIRRSLARFRNAPEWPDMLLTDAEQADSLGVEAGGLRRHAWVEVDGKAKVYFYLRDTVLMRAGAHPHGPLNLAFDQHVCFRIPPGN